MISSHFKHKFKGIFDSEYLREEDVANVCQQLDCVAYQKTQQNRLILFSCLTQCILIVYFDSRRETMEKKVHQM